MLRFFDGFDQHPYPLAGKWDYSACGNRSYPAPSSPFNYGNFAVFYGGTTDLTLANVGFVGNGIYIGFWAWGIQTFGAYEDYKMLVFHANTGADFGAVECRTDGFKYVTGSTTVATSTNAPLSASQWHHFGCEITFAEGTGQVSFWVDGLPTGSFYGLDTVDGSLSGRTLKSVTVGHGSNCWSLDDFYLGDLTGSGADAHFLGPLRVKTGIPNSDVLAQFTPNSGGANYAMVDDVGGYMPDNADTDFVTASVAGKRDNYGTNAVIEGTVYGVQANIVARRTDAALASLKLHVRSGTSDTSSSPFVMPLGYTAFRLLAPTDPATGAQWTRQAAQAAMPCVEVV